MKPKCALCGMEDQQKKTDHLRECYWFKSTERFDTAYYVPRLTYDERYLLQPGENFICSSRVACRQSQKAKATS